MEKNTNTSNFRKIVVYAITVFVLLILLTPVLVNCYISMTALMQDMVSINAEITDVKTRTVEKTYLIGSKAIVAVKKMVTKYDLTLKYTHNEKQYVATITTNNKYEIGDVVTITVSRTSDNIYSIE